ncbi:MAG TPA: DnaJ domain-containing protein [Dehalococcoidia bacterium]|nr:DnaJ domain-containing protein [Dehalococcoidia bacterium]
MSDRDYYEVLGLTPRADGTMVDQAYWHLARKYQQLATTNARGRRLLDDLNEAYGVLGNPRLRKEYDAFRDDVLVGKGVIGPVLSKPKKREQQAEDAAAAPRASRRRAPKLPEGSRVYAAAAAIAVLGAAGAVVLGAAALGFAALGLAVCVAAVPVVRSRVRLSMPELSMPELTLPAMPRPNIALPKVTLPDISAISLPDVTAPKPDLSRVSQHLAASREEAIDPDELRASTAAVIARWRKSMGLRVLPGQALPDDEPSTDLVEIVDTERQIEESAGEPLAAVIDILRGAHKKPVC